MRDAFRTIMDTHYLSKNEYEIWNNFVEDNPAGTFFSTTLWLKAAHENFKILGCFQDNNIIAGIAFFEKDGDIIHKKPGRFSGIIAKEGEYYGEAIKIISAELIKKYRKIMIISLTELPLPEFSETKKQTYFVDIEDIKRSFSNFEKRARYEARKAQKNGIEVFESDDIGEFDKMHKMTFVKQGKKREITSEFLNQMHAGIKKSGKLYLSRNRNKDITAGAIIVWDSKRAYYLMAASNPDFLGDGSPSLILWEAFKERRNRGLKEIDLAGANIPAIAKFKRGFGGKLKEYYLYEK